MSPVVWDLVEQEIPAERPLLEGMFASLGTIDLRWVRDTDGALVGSVKSGDSHRIVQSFDPGCGDEPRPEEGDVR